LTIEIIRKLINRSKEYERKIRLMERRVKELERETNSTSLIQPGFEEFATMGVVNCEFKNSVSNLTSERDTVFQNDGRVENGQMPDFDDGEGNDTVRECYLKFFHPVTGVIGAKVGFPSGTPPVLNFDILDNKARGESNLTVGIHYVLANWDVTTLTWNNRPTTFAVFSLTNDCFYDPAFEVNKTGGTLSQELGFFSVPGGEIHGINIRNTLSLPSTFGLRVRIAGNVTFTPGDVNNIIATGAAIIDGTADPETAASTFGIHL